MSKQQPQQYKFDEGISEVQKLMSRGGAIRTCANCEQVNLEMNICTKYGQTPPISVVSTGCPEWVLEIPF